MSFFNSFLLSTVNAGCVLGASHEVPAVQGIYKTWHCLWYNLLGLDPEQMHMRPSPIFLGMPCCFSTLHRKLHGSAGSPAGNLSRHGTLLLQPHNSGLRESARSPARKHPWPLCSTLLLWYHKSGLCRSSGSPARQRARHSAQHPAVPVCHSVS